MHVSLAMCFSLLELECSFVMLAENLAVSAFQFRFISGVVLVKQKNYWTNEINFDDIESIHNTTKF